MARNLIHFSLKHMFIVARSVRVLLCRIIEGLIVACGKGRIEVTENIPPPISCVFLTRSCPLEALCLGPAHARIVMFMCLQFPQRNSVLSHIITKPYLVNSRHAKANQLALLVFTAGIFNMTCQRVDQGSRPELRASAPTLYKATGSRHDN